ncbi:unnamed protein product [Rotaria magnacalcarata]|uniref:EF-hand domain-containing protein n=2 Tax=Rotaria magnacalcarata TaxID=392030 RepID=A0A816MHT0_9BILA|nr:unnamed protein product [Rotaria magnacalcarata]CAF1640399.1 unnamed protein product [Rotaria magnacalcarata]CAF2011723.1 unnamed protein product [Rotaria magnacalcarata]CAF2061419.1 unnamed protein product [Rotaria magnacalcarata]CAF2118948.1 unnamed protein product [Rotaria magnacalcarata]
MPIYKDKIAKCVSWIVLIFLVIQTAQVLSAFTDVPPPPKRPERFHSREELKRYLQLVHEYYAIIGRPRFGRSILLETRIEPNDSNLFKFFDINGDKSISYEEFHGRIGA